MDLEHILDDLARVVHDLWRVRMARDGWAAGAFDPSSRTHDALVPFGQLGRRDQLTLRMHVRAGEFERRLTEELRYERGPDRLFLVDEMHAGLEVAWCADRCPARRAGLAAADLGTVVSWRTAAGELVEVTVRWGDGRTGSYDPWERVLARAAELQ